MFLLLTRVLLWLLISVLIYYVLTKLIPKQYLTWLGGLILFMFVVLAFINPNDRLVSSAWSVLSFPLKPLGLSLLLLMMALREGIKKVSANLVLMSLLILLLSSTPFLTYQLTQQAEQEFVQIEQRRQEICQAQCPANQAPQKATSVAAIVVLGEGIPQGYTAYRTQIQLNDVGSRLLYAAQVYKEQAALDNRPLLIISVGPIRNNGGVNEIPTLLENLGVPSSRVVVESRGIDLRTSAVEVEQILKQRRLENQPIMLISSALNSHRARLTFAQMGIKVVPRATDFYSFEPGTKPRSRLQIEEFIPSVTALMVTTRVVEEYLSSIYYFLRGWLSPLMI
jgi:uncharacterized SAM-binding protein YcdF (DUF218 family)